MNNELILSRDSWEQICFPEGKCGVHRAPVQLKECGRIVLYGAGYGGLMFLELLRKNGMEPECFLDASPRKQGRRIMGIPVYAPDRIWVEHAVVIVCLLSMGETYRQIKAGMMALGCQNVFHLYELRGDRTLFADQPLIISPDCRLLWENRASLYHVYQGLGDKLSRQVLSSILRFLWGDLEAAIPSLPMKDQYFADDIYTLGQNAVFADCGAHVGEILQQFLLRSEGNFDAYWAFEPDEKNICSLETACPVWCRQRVHIIHTALGERSKTVRIRNYDGNNSVIREDGEEEAPCVPLDRFAQSLHPTVIKVDVEGWELPLLTGAQEIIRRDQPVLAIAVYHREQDFWEIPLFLERLVPDYRFYLRSYLNVTETILYAIPPEYKENKENAL